MSVFNKKKTWFILGTGIVFAIFCTGCALTSDADMESDQNAVSSSSTSTVESSEISTSDSQEESDSSTADGAEAVVQSKSFGTYTLSKGWVEATEQSTDQKFFYVKDGENTNPPSNISIEAGTNRYTKEEAKTFAEAIQRQIAAQTANSPTVSAVTGGGSYTEKGEVLITFTIQEESTNITTTQYYIVGDQKYILIIETDFHDKNVTDIDEVTQAMVDSFEWSE